MLQELVASQRAWTKATLHHSRSWTLHLPAGCQEIIEAFLSDCRESGPVSPEVKLSIPALEQGEKALTDLRVRLDRSPGFVILDRLPLERFSREEATLAYWLIGQMVGRPFPQNIRKTLLYDVWDTGLDYTQGARFSVTHAASSFHADGSFNPRMADYVWLLCLATAKSGGVNQLVSGYSLHNCILREYGHLQPTLYDSFPFDRRGEIRPGESETSQHAVFSWKGRELTVRYLRYYIEVASKKSGRPLSQRQREALEVVDRLLQRDDLRVAFSLEPGQILFTNNHWILHNRTAFEDHEDPKRRRHYVRLWLLRSDERPTG